MHLLHMHCAPHFTTGADQKCIAEHCHLTIYLYSKLYHEIQKKLLKLHSVEVEEHDIHCACADHEYYTITRSSVLHIHFKRASSFYMAG